MAERSDAASLLFVNQHYYPDVASTGQHLTDLAEHLAARGWDVHVLAAGNRYTAGRLHVPEREVRNGVNIRRVRGSAFGRGSHVGRIADYASFYIRVLWLLLTGHRYTGVVFLTTPPLLSLLGWIIRLLRRQRYGVWSMDLHPDAEIAAGMLDAHGVAGRFLEWANASGLRHADFVIDLGKYMKRRIVEKGVEVTRTHTVHVWSSREEVEPIPREENPLRVELRLADKFIVMYSGNAGLVHDFRDIFRAILLLREEPRLHFLFVGDGPRRNEIEAFAAEHDLRNFEYRDYFPRGQLRWSLSMADAHLISLRAPFVGISVPGKLYGIMASGRPALFVGPARCESADAIRDHQCGLVFDPAEKAVADRLAETLREWSRDLSIPQALGANGRQAFLRRYERQPNCEAFETVLRRSWTVTQDAPVGAAAAAARCTTL